jgi:hypothetical protein
VAVINSGLAALAFADALRPKKRKPGRTRTYAEYATLLTGKVQRSRGRHRGSVKHTAEQLRIIVDRVDAIKAMAYTKDGKVLSDRAALRIDMLDYYQTEKRDSGGAAKRHVARYLPRWQKALSRFRESQRLKEKGKK